MQYPIIDSLIYAYLRNNWTGLDLHPINIWNETWERGLITANGEPISAENNIRSVYNDPIRCIPNTTYYFISTAHPNITREVFFYDENYSFISYVVVRGNGTFTTSSNCVFIRFLMYAGYGNTYLNDISINYPSTYTSYISQEESEAHINAFKDDIAHRLRLPLVRNFPHSVIDSLKRASDGTMTNKDREILTHYLTPLGIGGI